MLIVIQDDEPPVAQPSPPPSVTPAPSGAGGGGVFDWLLLVALAGAFGGIAIRRRRLATLQIVNGPMRLEFVSSVPDHRNEFFGLRWLDDHGEADAALMSG